MQELWRDIPGYETLYQASTLGRIRTAPGKTTFTQRHGVRHWKSRIMKGRGRCPAGYRVGLWKDGACKDWLVARLVAMTWVDGYREWLTVNHINGDRFDNRSSNLEWLTLADNIRHGFGTGLYKNQKPVTLIDDTGPVICFRSMSEASRFLGCSHGYISDCITHGRKAHGRYSVMPGRLA